MNKGYAYKDGTVIIIDDQNNQKQSDYYDNLEEVLLEENKIEKIEERIQELNKYLEDNKCKKFVPSSSLPFFTIALIGIIACTIVNWSSLNETINTIYGVVNKFVLDMFYTTGIFTVMGIASLCVLILEHGEYKTLKEKRNSAQIELELLQKELAKERSHLEELQQSKTRDNENTEFRIVNLNSLEQLKALKRLLSLYRDLGNNIESYNAYYTLGKLEEKLSKYYTEEEIKTIESCIEEQGPRLIKKRKNIIRRD